MVSVSTNAQEIDYQIFENVSITSIVCVRPASIVFCGKEDGSVHVYDFASELRSQQLFVRTPGITINFLHFDERILTCADCASHVQLLACSKNSRLLVATESEDTLWDLVDSRDKGPLICNKVEGKRYWIQSAADPNNLLLMTPTGTMAYNWTSLESLKTISLDHLLQPLTVIDRATPLHHPRFFATITKNASPTQSSEPEIHVWNFRDFSLDRTIQSPVHSFGAVSSRVEAVIGSLEERLIYLDTDRWVCYIDLEEREERVIRHFFILNDWMISTDQLLLDLGSTGEIIFVKLNEPVVIKRGLKFTPQGSFDGSRKGSLTLRNG